MERSDFLRIDKMLANLGIWESEGSKTTIEKGQVIKVNENGNKGCEGACRS